MAGLAKSVMSSVFNRKNGGATRNGGTEHNPKNAESSRSLSQSFKEHHLNVAQLAQMYPSSNIDVENPGSSGGLSRTIAEQKLLQDGPNALEKPKEKSDLQLFLRQFFNMFHVLLLVAAVLSFITWLFDRSEMLNLYVAFVLLGIVTIMSIVTFHEERKAAKVIAGFANLLPANCAIIREGQERTLTVDNIVVGDIVVIRSGQRVPADIRILHSNNLKLETSSITGEAEPIDFIAEAAPSHKDVFDANNVAFNGSFCLDGDAIGVAIRTGTKTIIGQIATLTTEQAEEKTTLEIEISRFVNFIAISSFLIALSMFIIGCIMNNFNHVLDIFITGFLVIIVANVPQGLPATVSSELTIIARRLANKNVYLKRLGVVDAFGAATLIASDKTGTLTQNNMTVTDLWINKKFISGAPENKHRTQTTRTKRSVLSMRAGLEGYEEPLPDLLEVMCICNKAQFELTQVTISKGNQRSVSVMQKEEQSNVIAERLNKLAMDDLWKPTGRITRQKHRQISAPGEPYALKERNITGTPSEVALMRYVDGIISVMQVRRKYQTVFEIPFNSQRKYHLMIVKVRDSESLDDDGEDQCKFIVMLKGAPEVVISKCANLAVGDGIVTIDDGVMDDFQDAYDHFGNSGRRVIGCAMIEFKAKAKTKFAVDSGNFPQTGFTFLGIVAIMDPPRPDTANAIRQCKAAGIKVFMVTGDHPSTATAIAREIGLIGAAETVGAQHKRKQVKISLAQREVRDYAVVHGMILPTLTGDDWEELLEHNYIVFARTTPEQKLMIVEQCQSRGEIVCVTGDGVNDAPALKKADIGVAMGITGNDVAKQAADIVLMDDNFASIVKGIEEGRLLFDNLRKSIAYTLTHSMPEVVPICLSFVLGIPMTLTTLQILSIDLGTEMAPAVSLAYEGAEADIMIKPPRKRTTRLVSFAMLLYSYVIAGGMVILGAFGAYFYVYRYHHNIAFSDIFFKYEYYKHGAANLTSNNVTYDFHQQLDIKAEAGTAYYLTLVMSQFFHLWMCSTRRASIFHHGITNIVSQYALVIELLLVIFFSYTPGVTYIMGAKPPPFQVWAFPVIVGVCLWVYNETRKYFIRNWPQHPVVRVVKW